MTMDVRSVRFSGLGVAELRAESIDSEVGPTSLLVRSVVSLISTGTELNVFRGRVATPREVALPMMRGEFPFPIKFGYQVVGRVERAGSESRCHEGDLVLAQHPHQNALVIDESLVQPAPDGVTPRQAALATSSQCRGELSSACSPLTWPGRRPGRSSSSNRRHGPMG